VATNIMMEIPVKRISMLAAALLLVAPMTIASAQTVPNQAPPPAMPGMPNMPMPGMAVPGVSIPAPTNGEAPSTAAFRQAMDTMHAHMDIHYTGDADRDFVAGMIPHHQGAVDMAKVELMYGHDRELRDLAREIVKTQAKEIQFMRRWQARHGEKHATSK
jgi:hypothetical protein